MANAPSHRSCPRVFIKAVRMMQPRWRNMFVDLRVALARTMRPPHHRHLVTPVGHCRREPVTCAEKECEPRCRGAVVSWRQLEPGTPTWSRERRRAERLVRYGYACVLDLQTHAPKECEPRCRGAVVSWRQLEPGTPTWSRERRRATRSKERRGRKHLPGSTLVSTYSCTSYSITAA
jgi:hypothetical protein